MSVKVLCVAPYYEPAYIYGGPARSIPALCRELVRQGAEVTVLTTNANRDEVLDVPTGRALDVGGVQVTYFPRITRGHFFWSPGLARACFARAGEFDVVHINGLYTFPTLVAADAAVGRCVPFVVSPRGQLMPWARHYKGLKKALYFRLFERRRLERADALICTDASEAEAVQELGLTPPTYVVPNGIDMSRFRELPRRGAMRESLGMANGDVLILWLARLHPGKRPRLAVEAFGQVAARYGTAHLVFAGPDEAGMQSNLMDLAQRYQCADRVHFAGFLDRDEVRQALADADLFLMTSESENFGVAAVEAMAAGLPVVITDEIGLARFVADADGGRVVTSDPEKVADGLASLLQQPEMLREIGRQAQKAAVASFDLEVVARQMLECYGRVRSQYNEAS
jgi:glycosyltransferase involved in cell wall biosynthesis